MLKGNQKVVVFSFVIAIVLGFLLSGCNLYDDIVGNKDKDESSIDCSIGVNVSSIGGCKYHITFLLYDCDADFVTWSFDDGYWRDMDMRGMDTFTFEQAFPGVGNYAINVKAWKDGEVIASRSDGLVIDCK